MKNICFLLLPALFVSCSEDTPLISDLPEPDTSDPVIQKFELKLSAEKTKYNIFDLTSFYFTNGDSDASLAGLRDAYDSITWTTSAQKGSLKIFSHTSHSSSLYYVWSHSFYLPGRQDTYLHCYKDNRIIYSDTLSIEISNNKELLMYDWADIKETDHYTTGHHNALDDNYTLGSFRTMKDDIPSLRLSFRNAWDHEDEYADRNLIQLYDYACALYGQPDYDYFTADLNEKYDDLFSCRTPEAVPCAIWLTPKSKFVLLKQDDDDINKTFIHAEPL